jgi:ABC-2 type transport system ATP-binding protein
VVIHIDHDGTIPLSASYTIVEASKGHSKLEVTEVANTGEVLRDIVTAGVNVKRFAPSRKSLDDIFIEVYGDENEKEE